MVFFLFPAMALYSGYRIGYKEAETSMLVGGALQNELEKQRLDIDEARRTAEDNLNALALRMGQMQAHVMRLDALGQRLTNMAGLDDGEFNFEVAPALGGPENITAQQSLQVPDFIALLDNLSVQLENRGDQLSVLENMLLNRNLQAEVLPAGRPVQSGWISSSFGIRTDPFTGRLAHHNGIDFAGKEGNEVIAVASGVVTWAGSRFGYGNLVEINHGKGYVTRYGHNKSVEVKVGDTVKKGQAVAIMGSTGRSTGPHVHFEVLRNGRAVDPARYVYAVR
ncbi:MAG: M23 family metallopeptidase [Thiohalomonadaceae bacterium]